jgi:hypothetical protein
MFYGKIYNWQRQSWRLKKTNRSMQVKPDQISDHVGPIICTAYHYDMQDDTRGLIWRYKSNNDIRLNGRKKAWRYQRVTINRSRMYFLFGPINVLIFCFQYVLPQIVFASSSLLFVFDHYIACLTLTKNFVLSLWYLKTCLYHPRFFYFLQSLLTSYQQEVDYHEM